MESLLNQVTNETIAVNGRDDVDVTGERFGCSASSEREKRACSLYLWLLGPTTEQLASRCPCKS
jgi:hypothetical protein